MNDLDGLIVERYISEGIIAIDNEGVITRYNSKAKEIFGLSGTYDYAHKSGQLAEGDIILIADTNIGADDGGVNGTTLRAFGVENTDCKNAMSKGFLYIGRKGQKPYAYKLIEDGEKNQTVSLGKIIDGTVLSCKIDYQKKTTVIEVGSQSFEVDYQVDISNLVLIRGGDVIFYQYKGYSSRQESLKDILHGKPFIGKEGSYDIDVVGKNILDFHTHSWSIKQFVDIASGKESQGDLSALISINGYFVRGQIKPIDTNGKREGAFLIVEDISTLIKSQQERDAALVELDKLRKFNHIDFFPEICGVSVSMHETKRLAAKAAKSEVNVMILGESGTGKSFIAKQIHQKSLRADGPFIEINCSSIPSELIESELFGYAPGAFTNASNKGKRGFFELADGGTIFMDEIGDIPLNMQAKLLLFVQNRKFFKVGGDTEISVNIRIITATNKDIEAEVKEKRFREDLYYRFNVLPIYIEPLCERKEDVGVLIDQIVERQNEMHATDKVLTAGAKKILLNYHYPGNIREMENIIERAFVLCDSGIIYPEHLMLNGGRKSEVKAADTTETSLRILLDEYEKEIINDRLMRFGFNAAKTYRSLDIGKTSFYEKLRKLDIKT